MAFNPLDKVNLAVSIESALLRTPPLPLPPTESFPGTGLYVIYYEGDFELYRPLTEKHKRSQYGVPIYVGKAVSRGARSHLVDFSATPTPAPLLYRRLERHAASIRSAQNLDINDFRCRFLVLDEVWIPLGETLMIQHYRPLWNSTVTGFGNHDPGSRRPQLMSKWDTLHPGRTERWSAQLQPGAEASEVHAEVENFFNSSEFNAL